MPTPWRNWYHCMGNTYGTWLPGDPRGWRERHHRGHSSGDYKHPPPPGFGKQRHDAAKRRMKRPAVNLTAEQMEIVCRAMGDKLAALNTEVVELCVAPTHFHALVRFVRPDTQRPRIAMGGRFSERKDNRDPLPREIIGRAKKHASHVLRQQGIGFDGGIWGKRSMIEPIADRGHQVNVVAYIRRHADGNAALWSTLRDEGDART